MSTSLFLRHPWVFRLPGRADNYPRPTTLGGWGGGPDFFLDPFGFGGAGLEEWNRLSTVFHPLVFLERHFEAQTIVTKCFLTHGNERRNSRPASIPNTTVFFIGEGGLRYVVLVLTQSCLSCPIFSTSFHDPSYH